MPDPRVSADSVAPLYPELTDTLPPIDTMRGSDPELLFQEVLGEIRQAINSDPRSQQRRPGPSTLGTPCRRRIGYHFAEIEPVNVQPDAWKPTVGKATHAWIEDTLRLANQRLGAVRWLLETRLDVGQVAGISITGSCDAYDRITATAIDWKIMGDASLKRLRRDKNPGDQYRIQAHLYGRGWARRGLPIDTVAVIALPQNASLRDAYFWHEPYDEQIALDALTRADAIAQLINAAGTAALPLLKTADAYCTFCPFYLPASTELAQACPGHKAAATNPNPARPNAA